MGSTGTTRANGVEIAYETFGSAQRPPLVLVMGLGTQMIAWPDGFCGLLADAGFHVIRFDNRDVGLSTHFHDAPPPNIMAGLAGDRDGVGAAYRLEDMAADTVGLLDALSLDSAHLVGASMGGMIAQTVAIRHPKRIRSLTSLMSTPGPSAGRPTPAALAALFRPPASTREEAVAGTLEVLRVIGSPGHPFDEPAMTELIGRSYDRAYDPAGILRQMGAIAASGDRTEALHKIGTPALVIHGRQDPLIQFDGGEATAAAIPGAHLLAIDGMGHDLPVPLWREITDAITAHAKKAEDQN